MITNMEDIERRALTTWEEARCEEITLERHKRNKNRGLQSHRKFGRLSDYDISLVGFRGEYIVRQLLGLGGFEQFDYDGPDKGKDILLPWGEWIEVKTTTQPGYQFAIEEWDWAAHFRAEYGVLVWPGTLHDPTPGYAVVGWCTREEFRESKVWKDQTTRPAVPSPCWLMPWQRFHPLKDLRERILQFQQPTLL
jgi:hypothetical protein